MGPFIRPSNEKAPFFLHKVYVDLENDFEKESGFLKIEKEKLNKVQKADAEYTQSLNDLTNRAPKDRFYNVNIYLAPSISFLVLGPIE